MKSFGKKYLVSALIAASIFSSSYMPKTGKSQPNYNSPVSITHTYNGVKPSAPVYVGSTQKQNVQLTDSETSIKKFKHPGVDGYTSEIDTSKGDYIVNGEKYFAKEATIQNLHGTSDGVSFNAGKLALNYSNNLEGVVVCKDKVLDKYTKPIKNGHVNLGLPENLENCRVGVAAGNEIIASVPLGSGNYSGSNHSNRGRVSSNGDSALPPLTGDQGTNGGNGTGSTGQGHIEDTSNTQDTSKFPIYCAENCTEPIQEISNSYGKTKANTGNWVVLKPVNPEHKIIKEDSMYHGKVENSKVGNSIVLRSYTPEKGSVRIEYLDNNKLKSATIGLEFLVNSVSPGEPTITENNLTPPTDSDRLIVDGSDKKGPNVQVFTQWLFGKPKYHDVQGKETIIVNKDHKFGIREQEEGTPYLVKVNNPELAAQIRAGKINYNTIKKGDFSRVRLYHTWGNNWEINLEGKTIFEDKLTNISWGTGKYTYAEGEKLNNAKIRMNSYVERDGVKKQEEKLFMYYIIGRDTNGNLDIKYVLFFEAATNPVKEYFKGLKDGLIIGATGSSAITLATMPEKILTLEKIIEVAVGSGELPGTIIGGPLVLLK